MPEQARVGNIEQENNQASSPRDVADEQMLPSGQAQSDTSWLLNFKLLMIEAVRVSVLKRPRWGHVRATPGIVVVLVLAYLLFILVSERLAITGPARFYWQAIGGNWFSFASWVWICYSLRQAVKPLYSESAPDASHLFVLSMAQGWVIAVATHLPVLVLMRMDWLPSGLAPVLLGVVSLLFLILAVIVQSIFLWRASDRRRSSMVVAVFVMLMAAVLQMSARPPVFWYSYQQAKDEEDTSDKSPEITQEVFETQVALFNQKLSEVLPQRPGVIDLYSLTFAPYGEEDVFLNETSMVSQVMQQRFDATGRSLQLANNPKTMESLPWATPLNLQRAIAHIAKRMDVNEDILFIHMSSHGASDGELSAGMWPLSVNPVTPEDLKRWLDEAGIKHRVISISACFAGNWVAPLSNPDSLVMTASDADHTSYGCGSKSDLTFFGRAMYDEQLRKKTLSFEAAHAAARPIIKQRENEAGKTDGYSNPQIAVGDHIRVKLQQLEQRLQKSANTTATPSTLK